MRGSLRPLAGNESLRFGHRLAGVCLSVLCGLRRVAADRLNNVLRIDATGERVPCIGPSNRQAGVIAWIWLVVSGLFQFLNEIFR